MREYFAYLGDFLHRIIFRIQSVIGAFLIVALIVSVLVTPIPDAIILPAVIIVLGEAGYGVYREERQMRAERERTVKVTAKVGSLASNSPDPGRDKSSLRVHVFWEVWVNQDISTDKLALNVIYVYDKPWWQFWKKTRFPKRRMRQKEPEDTAQYRKTIRAADNKPFRDDATFEYVGDRWEAGDPHWELELVLITGMPLGEHRIPVFIDYEEIHSRGTYPPL